MHRGVVKMQFEIHHGKEKKVLLAVVSFRSSILYYAVGLDVVDVIVVL